MVWPEELLGIKGPVERWQPNAPRVRVPNYKKGGLEFEHADGVWIDTRRVMELRPDIGDSTQVAYIMRKEKVRMKRRQHPIDPRWMLYLKRDVLHVRKVERLPRQRRETYRRNFNVGE